MAIGYGRFADIWELTQKPGNQTVQTDLPEKSIMPALNVMCANQLLNRTWTHIDGTKLAVCRLPGQWCA